MRILSEHIVSLSQSVSVIHLMNSVIWDQGVISNEWDIALRLSLTHEWMSVSLSYEWLSQSGELHVDTMVSQLA